MSLPPQDLPTSMVKKRRFSQSSQSSDRSTSKGARPPSTHTNSPERLNGSTPLLLTRENLSLVPGSPPRPTSMATSTSGPKSRKTTSSIPTLDARNTLAVNHMHMHNAKAFDRAQSVVKTALEIVDQNRHSPAMDEAHCGELAALIRESIEDNEAIFGQLVFDSFFLGLEQKNREVLKSRIRNRAPQDVEEAESDDWVKRSYSADFLKINVQRNWDSATRFLPDIMHEGKTSTRALTKLCEEYPKLSRPQPDRCIGLKEYAFIPAQLDFMRAPAYKSYFGMSPNMMSPFLNVELKSPAGSRLDAELQACRAAAILVCGLRTVKDLAGLVDAKKVGVDDQSFVYSMVMDYDVANWYLNWAEVEDDGMEKTVRYYMHSLGRQYFVGTEQGIQDLFREFKSILDWGVGDFKNEVAGIVDILVDKHRKGELDPEGKKPGKSTNASKASSSKNTT